MNRKDIAEKVATLLESERNDVIRQSFGLDNSISGSDLWNEYLVELISIVLDPVEASQAADQPERFDSAAYFASLEADAAEGRPIVVSPAMTRRAGFDAADYRKLAEHLANGSPAGPRRVVAVPYPR